MNTKNFSNNEELVIGFKNLILLNSENIYFWNAVKVYQSNIFGKMLIINETLYHSEYDDEYLNNILNNIKNFKQKPNNILIIGDEGGFITHKLMSYTEYVHIKIIL